MNQLVSIFKMLSDETRFRIIILLAQQELCVCQISGIMGVSQPKVSKNLSKLRDMNLVTDERNEKYVFYSLKDDNAFLTSTVKNILENLEKYPMLIQDRERIKDKEMYLIQCCNIGNE